MSPKSEHVSRELLAIGFRAYPRGLTNGFLFACLTMALFWPRLPHGFLAAWYAVYAAILAARLALARAFLRSTPPAEQFDEWTRYAALGFAATGLAWGTLGAAAMHLAPGETLYAVWPVFLIALFAVQHTQNTGAHPWVFRAFLLGAMGPIVAVSLVEDSPIYFLRLLAVAIFFGMALLAGRSGNRYMVDSITMRYENIELLRDLKRQADELDRANAAKTRFLAAASHDLRQPMQAISLLVESLQGRATPDPAAGRIVQSMRTSIAAMSALLNEILDISKLDAGTVKPQPSVFPVARVLDRLRSSFSHTAAQDALTLRVRPCAATVETDEVLLYRVLVNLTNNALRYTRAGGVLIGCRPRGDALSIEVWDTGVGIPNDKLKEIFREFHQLANPQRDREQGLGLGLAIVERTAQLLGLRLEVRSRLGRGSVFSLTVPRGDPARMRRTEPAAPIDALEGFTVLVVENERDIRAALTLLLEGWKCRVASVASGTEVDRALAELGAPPDAVIADYGLGGENGIQVMDRLRRDHPSVAGILVSGDVSREALMQADLAGYPMLHKPVRPARLRAMLGSIRRERHGARDAA
jgi:signal transduction histidine kinase/CheY-like chemotaxis protein